MTLLTFVSCDNVILLLMTMNMQKILHSYKQWQDYNKQLDIGLMTLYHHQEMTKINYYDHQVEKSILEQERNENEMYDQSLHYEVQAELLEKENVREKLVVTKKHIPLIRLKKVQLSPFMRKHGAKSCPFTNEQSIEKRKMGVGYYDVTQLSNLKTHRPMNQPLLPLLDRLNKSRNRKHSTLQTQRQSPIIVSSRLERSLKLMSQRKAPSESPKRLVLKTTEYITGVKQKGVKEKWTKNSNLKTQRDSSKPINYIDYKLISHRQFQIKEKGKDYRNSFKKEIKQENQRYYMAIGDCQPNSKSKSKILNELNLVKLKRHCRTLMGSQQIEDRQIREAISNYFTPVELQDRRKHSHSLDRHFD